MLPNNSIRIQRESYGVFALGLLLFTLGIWQQPFIDFESRFAVFAQEMWRHGISLFPTTYGEPYPDYPVTGTLLIWLFSLPFGGVIKFSAVLPTAIAAALNLAILYRLLAPLSRQWAVLALSLQIMTATFLTEARAISLDQMVATISLLSFYCVYSAQENRQRLTLFYLAVLLLLGFAVRGPLGVVVPAAIVVSYRAVNRQWRELVQFGVVAAVVLVAAWAALLLSAAKIYGDAFMHEVIRMQVVGRLEKHDALPWSYYITSSFGNYALAYPLAILAIMMSMPALRRGTTNPQRHLFWLLLAWFAIVLIGLSVPAGKKARYLLSIVPALSALAAYPWVDNASNKALVIFKAGIEKLFLALPALLFAGCVWGKKYAAQHALELPNYFSLIVAGLIVAQSSALIVQWRVSARQRAAALAVIAAFSMWLGIAFIVEPARAQAHDTTAFVAKVEAQRALRSAPLVLLNTAKDGEAIKYIVNVQGDLQPIFVDTAAELEKIARPYLVVVSDADLKAIAPPALTDDVRIVHEHFNGHPFSAFYLP